MAIMSPQKGRGHLFCIIFALGKILELADKVTNTHVYLRSI